MNWHSRAGSPDGNGLIDDVLLYTRVPTNTEATQLYLATSQQYNPMLNWVEAGLGSVEEAASPVTKIFLPSLLAVA